jgi:Alpha-glutamyl/putrescinyl thymine pyrophosphorylase clade 3
VRPSDAALVRAVTAGLDAWAQQHSGLPGLVGPGRREAFVGQLVDSDRRRRFVEHFRTSERLTVRQADPSSGVFDPYAAATLAHRRGDLDDALWLVFLATHIGHHARAKWAYTARVYGRLGEGRWDWATVTTDLVGFDNWLQANAAAVKQGPGGFGNHRKYESLAGTGVVAASYAGWIGPDRGHHHAIAEITAGAAGVPADEFEMLYKSSGTARLPNYG